MKKNILLISYNFPPIGGPRSLRWLHLLKYLDKDYSIDLLTIRPEKECGNYDSTLSAAVPKGITIHRTYPGPIHKFSYRYLPPEKIRNQKNYKNSFKILLREKAKKVYKRIVEPMLIPDKMIEWLPWGLRMAKKLIREKHYDVIISSAMPFTAHIIAYFAKKKSGIPWISDYGDPWTFDPISPKIKWRHLMNKWVESRLLKAMDQVIVTTDETKKGFIEYYPFLKKEKTTVISQGYDQKEFEMIQPELGNKFRIVYTGIFYDEIREPYTFFDAIRCLKNIELEVIVAGNVLSHHARAPEEKGLKEKIVFLGHQSHKRVIALQKGADMLLLFGWLKGYQIPGKIFEYFGACRPILCITFDEKDIARRLIKKYNRGIVVSNKPEEIASAIRKIYELWQKGKIKKQFRLEPLKKYSWESQAKELENVLKNVIDN